MYVLTIGVWVRPQLVGAVDAADVLFAVSQTTVFRRSVEVDLGAALSDELVAKLLLHRHAVKRPEPG